MRYALFCAAFATSAFAASTFAASALALELNPGGAFVPEETRAVEEAREWHDAALKAALEDDILSREAELEEVERLEAERQSGRCIGCLARVCCGLERCRWTSLCRAHWAQVEMIRQQG
jgi:hypothetical protein